MLVRPAQTRRSQASSTSAEGEGYSGVPARPAGRRYPRGSDPSKLMHGREVPRSRNLQGAQRASNGSVAPYSSLWDKRCTYSRSYREALNSRPRGCRVAYQRQPSAAQGFQSQPSQRLWRTSIRLSRPGQADREVGRSAGSPPTTLTTAEPTVRADRPASAVLIFYGPAVLTPPDLPSQP